MMLYQVIETVNFYSEVTYVFRDMRKLPHFNKILNYTITISIYVSLFIISNQFHL